MYKRVKKKKLGRTASHRKSLKKNLMTSLLENGKVTTTSVKAKVLKTEIQNLFELLEKQEGVNLVRNLKSKLMTAKASKIAQSLKEKSLKKVSIVKVGFRKGDNAEKSTISIIGYDELKKKDKIKTEKK